MGIDDSRPIPLLEIANQLGIVVRFGPLPRLAGAYVRSDGAPPGILVSTRLPPSKQRYTLAHELGHHLFGHTTTLDADIEDLNTSDLGEEERQAETFAAWLMMPRRLVERVIGHLQIEGPLQPRGVYTMAMRMRSSYRATAFHLATLKKMTHSEADRLAAVEPRRVKAELMGSSRCALGRADVHLIDVIDHNESIGCKPGDLVVVAGRRVALEPEVATRLDHAIPGELFGGDRQVWRIDDCSTVNPDDPAISTTLTFEHEVGGIVAVHVVVEPPRRGIGYRWFEPEPDS